jgi:hypothetical protein
MHDLFIPRDTKEYISLNKGVIPLYHKTAKEEIERTVDIHVYTE